MIIAPERALRRLRSLFRKHERAVGFRGGPLEVALWEAWSQSLGRCRVVAVRPGFRIELGYCRKLAAFALGPEALAGYEHIDGRTYFCAVRIDRDEPFPGPVAPEFRWPAGVRWFDYRGLCATIGQQDNGFWQPTYGRQVVPV